MPCDDENCGEEVQGGKGTKEAYERAFLNNSTSQCVYAVGYRQYVGEQLEYGGQSRDWERHCLIIPYRWLETCWALVSGSRLDEEAGEEYSHRDQRKHFRD